MISRWTNIAWFYKITKYNILKIEKVQKVLHLVMDLWFSFNLKHTTALFALSDHYIIIREWTVIVDQILTSYHGRPIVL